MADIDAGTFAITYDEESERYVIIEQLEGQSGFAGDVEGVLDFIREHLWTPDADTD